MYHLLCSLRKPILWVRGVVLDNKYITTTIRVHFVDGTCEEVERVETIVLYQEDALVFPKRFAGNLSGSEIVNGEINLTGFIHMDEVDDSLIVVNFVAKNYYDVDDYLHRRTISPTMSYRNN